MRTRAIERDILAVTEREIAEVELSQEVDGTSIGKPVESLRIKRLTVLYMREDERWIDHCNTRDVDELSSKERFQERLQGLRLGVIGTLLDYELHLAYGKYVSDEEHETGEVLLEIREGWVVYKCLADIPDEDLSEQLDEMEGKKDEPLLH